jgi:hypothetical protein
VIKNVNGRDDSCDKQYHFRRKGTEILPKVPQSAYQSAILGATMRQCVERSFCLTQSFRNPANTLSASSQYRMSGKIWMLETLACGDAIWQGVQIDTTIFHRRGASCDPCCWRHRVFDIT